MTAKAFSLQLGILTGLTVVALILFNRYPLFGAHQALYWAILGFYFLSAVLLFAVGKKLAASPNRNSFTLFIMGAVFIKMMLTMAVLVVYLKFAEPASKYFILPFLTVYLVFTVFETYFLMKIAKTQATP